VDGPSNGPWKVRVGPTTIEEWRNPLAQAIDATYALSDALHEFAATAGAPSPTAGKFYRDIDSVVCVYPSLHDGSSVQRRAHVSVLGYGELVERLQTPGPVLRWSQEDWDGFRRHLNLYREEEDSPEALVRHAGTAAVDTYLGLFLREHADLPPLVPTGVHVGGQQAPRPDIPSLAAGGRAVLLTGGSGLGKTLWARHAVVELARAGHVPIWLAAEVCEESFKIAVARAVAPYTTLPSNDLLRAADVAGRAAVFVVDDLSKARERVRRARRRREDRAVAHPEPRRHHHRPVGARSGRATRPVGHRPSASADGGAPRGSRRLRARGNHRPLRSVHHAPGACARRRLRNGAAR
jgi:hypothetical protein